MKPVIKAKKRFAAFVRVSTREQAEEGMSLGDQLAHAKDVVKQHSGTLVRVYEAPGESGHRARPRPVFDGMLNDFHAGCFDAVIFANSSRMSRNARDVVRLHEAVADHGLMIYEAGRLLDLDNATVFLISLLKAAASGAEVDDRARSSARSWIKGAALGFATSGGFPFGRTVRLRAEAFKRRADFATNERGLADWVVDPKAKKWIEKAASLYLRRSSWLAVARDLPPWPQDKPGLSERARAKVLRERVLSAGSAWPQSFPLQGVKPEELESMANRHLVKIEGRMAIVSTPGVPALLSEELIARCRDKAQDRYTKRDQGVTRTLSRLLRCQQCSSGLAICGERGGNRLVRVQHFFPKEAVRTCPSGFGGYDALETNVLGVLGEMLRDTTGLKAAVRRALAVQVPEADTLRKRVAEHERRRRAEQKALDVMRNNLRTVLLDPEEADVLGQDIAKAKGKLAQLDEQISEARRKADAAVLAPDTEQVIERVTKRLRSGRGLLQSNPDARREMMLALFGGGAHRAGVAGENAGTGIFLERVVDRGVPFVRWRAVGRFFTVADAVMPDDLQMPGINMPDDIGAKRPRGWFKRDWTPSPDDLQQLLPIACGATQL